MFAGGCTSMAPGDTRDMILELSGAIVDGEAACILKPADWYRDRWWTFFIGAKWCGKCFYVPASGDLEFALPIDPNTDPAAIWAIEVGDWDNFDPDTIPDAEALYEEAANCDTFVPRWKGSYQLTAVTGDSQLSNISIVGARRGRNVAPVPYFKQRGRLTYSIFQADDLTTKIIRWYAGNRLVAEGTTTSTPSAVECTEKNGSGLTINCTLTYSNDLAAGEAFLDVKWPKYFEIHHDDAPLIFPRTAEATRQDNGNDEYFYRITGLPAGSRYYAIVQVDDEGDKQTIVTAPGDSPKTMTPGPLPPTNLQVAQGAAAVTLLSQSTGSGTGTSISFNATMQALTNPLVVIAVWYRGSSIFSPTATIDGVAMSTGPEASFGLGQRRLKTFYARGYSAGSRAFVVTLPSSSTYEYAIMEFSGANPSGSVVIGTYDAQTNVANLTLDTDGSTYVTNRLYLALSATFDAAGAHTVTPGSNQTLIIQDTGVVGQTLGIYTHTVATDVEFSYSVTADDAAAMMLTILPDASFYATWDTGESGCTYTVYKSGINEPVNFGQGSTPAPVGPSAVDATSANLGSLTGAAATDVTSDFATLVTAYDVAVYTGAVAFSAGESGFLTALSTLRTSLYACVDAWGDAIGKTLFDAKNKIDEQISILESAEASIADEGLTTTEWKDFMGAYFSGLLLYLGALLEGQSGRYVFKNGVAPAAAPAGSGAVTDNAPDGSASAPIVEIQQSLKAAGEPFVKYGYLRFAVRASKDTGAGVVEERNDQIFTLEINGINEPQFKRPNDAQIKELSFAGGVLTAVIVVPTSNQLAEPLYVDLYVVTRGSAITLSSAQASGTLSADLGGYKQVTVQYTMPGAAWYDIAAVARSAAGQRSENYDRKAVEYGGGTAPGDVESVSAEVRRNHGIRPEEEA